MTLAFGVSRRSSTDLASWRAAAATAEADGFDVLWVPDHIGLFDPFPALVAAAAATERVRVGVHVANAGFWNPLLLARAAVTTDVLSGGRLVLGVGAGHAEVEFDQAGLRYPPAGERVDRLAALVPVLRRLLDGETVDDDRLGLRGATVGFAAAQAHVPILVGGNGNRVLRIGAGHADRVGVVGFTSGTGQVHTDLSHWTWDGLADRLAVVDAAAPSGRRPHVDVLVQQVVVTDDRQAVAAGIAERTGVPPEVHLDSPFVLFGTEREIADQLERLDDVLGDGTVTVFANSAPALAPVIAAFRNR